MKTPHLPKSSRLTAVIPALSGGLDANDPAFIADNALADAENLWWHDGALCCRTGFSTDEDHLDWLGHDTEYTVFTDREGYRLLLCRCETEVGCEISVMTFDAAGCPTPALYLRTLPSGGRVFAVPSGGTLTNYTALLWFSDGTLIGAHPRTDEFDDLTDSAYVPLISINGTPHQSATDSTVTGTCHEGRNCLCDRFRCTFSSDGTGIYYVLPERNLRGDVTVSVNGTVLTIPFSQDASPAAGGYTAHVNRTAGRVWLCREGTPAAVPAGERENIVITAENLFSAIDIAAMRFGAWYGGDRSSVSGGTRLFLSGCAAHPATVVWSDLNNPLYFPASAYAVVGTPDRPLVAMAGGGSRLYLFKENEIYAADCLRGDTLSADAVADVTAAVATFPLSPVSGDTGCDLPQTIARVGQKLVFACRDGSVYALGQSTVTRLSRKIEPLLRKTAPTAASAASVDGRYYLLWGNDIFVLDEENRFHRFSWHQPAVPPRLLYNANGRLQVGASLLLGEDEAFIWFTEGAENDTAVTATGTAWYDAVFTFAEMPVVASCTTKAYDMGQADRRKTADTIFAEVRARSPVSASYVTERGTLCDLPHTPEHGAVTLSPHLDRFRRLSVTLSGEGLRVGSITLSMRQ